MNSQPQTNSSNPRWDLLAEIQLLLNNNQHQTIHDWLSLTLEPLKLHEDFRRRVETSLQEAATRASSAPAEKQPQHIHVKIYLPAERTAKGNNWSFFRVEKIEASLTEDVDVPDHAIELYLYLEHHGISLG